MNQIYKNKINVVIIYHINFVKNFEIAYESISL